MISICKSVIRRQSIWLLFFVIKHLQPPHLIIQIHCLQFLLFSASNIVSRRKRKFSIFPAVDPNGGYISLLGILDQYHFGIFDIPFLISPRNLNLFPFKLSVFFFLREFFFGFDAFFDF